MPKAEDYLEQNHIKTRQVEITVLAIFQDLSRKVQDAVQALHVMISDWAEGKDSVMDEHLDHIVKLEKQADKFKRDIFNTLSKATTLLQRGDLMDIVTIVDLIIDEAEGSAHILKTLTDFDAPTEVRSKINELLDPVNHIVRETREIIRILPVNTATAVEISHHVDDIERQIDTEQRKTRHFLLKNIESAPLLILTLDLVAHLESIADSCEDAADALRIYGLGRLQ